MGRDLERLVGVARVLAHPTLAVLAAERAEAGVREALALLAAREAAGDLEERGVEHGRDHPLRREYERSLLVNRLYDLRLRHAPPPASKGRDDSRSRSAVNRRGRALARAATARAAPRPDD